MHRSSATRTVAALLIASLCALALQLTPGAPGSQSVRADSAPVPKAVFIVGPTGSLTDQDLTDAGKMADQAEAAGMDVHRVFFPHATWENVLANIQDASLVVYMGHGYGWPSPYTSQLTESRQDGMGLNSWDGSGPNQYTYYGANKIRESVTLAPNAVVYLNHLCYASGNGEPGMSIPSADLARERVDNFASGWLAVGARAVFAYGWWQKLNYPDALMNTDKTMDELFMTVAPGASAGSPHGYVGWNPATFDSVRTPGAVNHLDPHKKYGYYRAVSGDLSMTAGDFRAGAGTPPPPADPGNPPEITALTALGDGSSTNPALTGGNTAQFHPNGDGLDEQLLLTHDVTKDAYLDATVTDSDGQTVRNYSFWAPAGTSASEWNGRNTAGYYVPDGLYTLTYVPRDKAGQVGDPVAVQALVLTAAKLLSPSKPAFFARDADSLARKVALKVKLNKTARLTWQVLADDGSLVRTIKNDVSMAAGKYIYKWNGRTDSGSWAPDGWYHSVVTATTSLGSYTEERQVYLGPYRVTPSTDTAQRGDQLALTILSSEPMSGTLTLTFKQPGVQPWDASATRLSKKKFKITVTLDAGGDAGDLEIVISGKDKYGGTNQGTFSLPLS